MLFNSFDFLLFFPLVLFVYFGISHRWRWLFLLLSSYFFYGCWNWKYLILIITSTVITYYSGILIEKVNLKEELSEDQKRKKKKSWVALSLVLNLGILFFFKYFNFAMDTASFLFSFDPTYLNVLLPVGISFYTFQALSYTLDVYYGRIETEKHLGKYALFVSFFPQLVAGPIEKANHLLPQMHTEKQFSYEQFRSGLLLMAWGFVKKVVIADRLSIFVNSVYGDIENAAGVALLFAVLFFIFQLYLDFSAYSDIAIGSARIMGFDISINFRRPYLATSFSDFWKRWHISLSSWFKEYLYIPLGGNKKGRSKMIRNVMIVFLVSGLWHGASWNFVIWGGMNGLLMLLLDRFLIKQRYSFPRQVLHGILITAMWGFTLIFFRAETFADAINVLSNIGLDGGEKLYTYGLKETEFNFALALVVFLYLFEMIEENKPDLYETFTRQPIVMRWAVYLGLIFATILLGSYGVGMDDTSFIYFQF